MANDMAQQNLKEPETADWDNWNAGSKYAPPPPAVGPDGAAIIYYGVVGEAKQTDPDEGYLNILLDPIKIVRSGSFDGQTLRFTRASVKPFTKAGADGNRTPIKGNPNKLGNYLRACGLQAKPQTNSEYLASVKATMNKPFPFTLDWEAYNKDTGERIRGFVNFPDDPERPGQKKSILRAGDTYTERDSKGNVTGTKTVTSEVLFANARLRYFKDAAPRTGR